MEGGLVGSGGGGAGRVEVRNERYVVMHMGFENSAPKCNLTVITPAGRTSYIGEGHYVNVLLHTIDDVKS